MIKNFVKVFVLAALLVTAAQSSAGAEEWQNIRINNNSGITITEVYFQPATADNWGNNYLDGTMPDGYGLDLSYVPGFNYEFKFVFEDGSEAEWSGDNNFYLNGQTQVSVYVNSSGYYEMSIE
ncbi:MAG: hypothetical protein IKI08_01205 [Selenomonadaceae bacterium]|nr:hypothetical protein [Selenomonadaceae bacterium]